MMNYILLNDMSKIKGVNKPKSDVGFKKMGQICDAAGTLFDKKGFYDTSVADICSLAKTAVGTFYIYFQDKTAIYKYLVRNYYVVIKNYLNEQIADCKTRYEMEREGLKAFIRFGHKHPQCYKIIWGSSHIDPVIFEDYYTRFAKGYVSALRKFSSELINVDYETAVWVLMGIANFCCLKSILKNGRLSEKNLNALVDEVMKLISKGLFKPPGPAAKKKAGKAKT
jgi:AcrR family transcriptional regulator